MRDVKIVSTLDGGDIEIQGNDIATVNGVENVPFLAMFGGDSWCLNFLTDKKFQSQTEKKLLEVVLNSAGRQEILDAVNADMSFLNDIPGTTWQAAVTLEAPNRIRINVGINGQQFETLWNPKPAESRAVIPAICPIITGLTVDSSAATSITFSWDENSAVGYQWAVSTINTAPSSGTDTTADSIIATGLTPGIRYYVFVRSKCADDFYSAWASTSVITVATAPITTGLVLELYSFQNITRSGTDVDSWNDSTANNNDLIPVTPSSPAQYAANVYGTLPAIVFNNAVASQAMYTPTDLVGVSGESAITVFTLSSDPEATATNYLWSYSDIPASVTAGEVEAYQSTAVGINFVARGNVGIQSGTNGDELLVPKVTAITLDFTQPAATEGNIFVAGSDASYVAGTTSNNTGTMSSAPFWIGQGDVSIGSVLVYNRRLSPSEITTITDYLTTLFGL